jgi:phasin family protein
MATSSKSGADFDFARMFADMKFPAMVDLEALTTATRRNMEALTAANRVALEGAQAVARRHMEIMQQSMAEMSEAMRSLAGAETPQARAGRQAELVKQAYERAVANLKELSDLIQRSNQEALALLNRRFTEAMDELKAMAEKTK